MMLKRSLLIAAIALLASESALAQTASDDDGTGSQPTAETKAKASDKEKAAQKTDTQEMADELSRLRRSVDSIDQFELGSLLQQGYFTGGVDRKGAYDLYEKAANSTSNIAPARQLMCTAYLLGEDRPTDYAKAMSYCSKLKPDNPAFLFAGAYDYDHGLSGPKDADAAFGFYVEAAKAGSAEAMDALGTKFLKDPAKAEVARAWFHQSALLGSADGMDHLAGMMAAGQGGPADADEATWLYVNAARRGNAHAKAWLDAQPQPPLPLPRVVLDYEKRKMITETVTDQTGTHTRPFSFKSFTPNEEGLFPKGALENGVGGIAVAHCYIAADHRIDMCLLQREYPVGLNFGPIVQAMMSRPLTVSDKDVNDVPTANTVYAFALRWQFK